MLNTASRKRSAVGRIALDFGRGERSPAQPSADDTHYCRPRGWRGRGPLPRSCDRRLRARGGRTTPFLAGLGGGRVAPAFDGHLTAFAILQPPGPHITGRCFAPFGFALRAAVFAV